MLYFFPAAYTGGCNQEAHDFSEAVPQFQAAGATVIGMSTDSVDRLRQFCQENARASSPWRAPGRAWSRRMTSRWAG